MSFCKFLFVCCTATASALSLFSCRGSALVEVLVWHGANIVFLLLFVCCTTTVSSLSLCSCMGSASAEVLVKNEAQVSLSPAHSAWLEVWTDDAQLPVSAKRHQQQAAVHDQNLGQLHISIQASSVLDPGKNCNGCDLIIGKPGMLKLGLGIDATTGCICNVKRTMQK